MYCLKNNYVTTENCLSEFLTQLKPDDIDNKLHIDILFACSCCPVCACDEMNSNELLSFNTLDWYESESFDKMVTLPPLVGVTDRAVY